MLKMEALDPVEAEGGERATQPADINIKECVRQRFIVVAAMAWSSYKAAAQSSRHIVSGLPWNALF